MTAPIVFLDRDGTLNVDTGYVCSPDRLVLFDDAAPALALLKSHGFRVIVVTNQSAIGRGIASVAEVEATNEALCRRLRAANPAAVIDRLLYCPHGPDESCRCRKPLTGMLEELPEASDLRASWIVGDKLTDLRFGANAGIPPERQILVLTGEGARELERLAGGSADLPRSAANVLAAARLIVSDRES